MGNNGVGLSNYKRGPKNIYRRWSLNQAIRRLNKSRSEIRVLYLPSKQNLDGMVALQKRLKKRNLFAVERDKNIAAYLKKHDVNVIYGDFNDILANWSLGYGPKIDFVYADFCCGITNTALDFCRSIICSRGLSDSVVIVANFLRGHDGGEIISLLRQRLRELFQYSPELKHRGRQFLILLWCTSIQFAKMAFEKFTGNKITDNQFREYFFDDFEDIMGQNFFDANFYSYRSGMNIMDSVAFNWNSIAMQRIMAAAGFKPAKITEDLLDRKGKITPLIDLGNDLLEATARHHGRTVDDDKELLVTALLAKPNMDYAEANQRFEVSKGTFTAIKAHVSMGTYD